MAPSDDQDPDKLEGLEDEPVSRNTPYLSSPHEGAGVSLPEPGEHLSDMDVPLENLPEFEEDELRVDTLEFKTINPRRKPKRGGLKLIMVLLVLGGGGYAAWAQWGDAFLNPNSGELPIVRAPVTPFKERPEQPGGINISDRDKLVYDRLEKEPPEAMTENLLPRPEIPLSPPISKSLERVELAAKPALGKPIGPQSSAADGQALKKATPPEGKAKVERKVVAVSPKITAAAKPPFLLRASNSKDYQIQLAAVKNAAAAKQEWARLQKKYASLLGKLSLNVVRADLGKKGLFYRLRTGSFENQTAAKALCQSLAKLKVACLVIRPGK
jgi:hypothetical protein